MNMANPSAPDSRRRFGEILVRAGLVDEFILKSALDAAEESELDIGYFLMQYGRLKAVEMVKAVSKSLGLTRVGLDHAQPDSRALARIEARLCRKYWVLPIELESGRDGEVLHLAMANPTDVAAIQEVAIKAACPLRILVASGNDIRKTLRRFFPPKPGERDQGESGSEPDCEDLFDINEATPVVPHSADVVAMDIGHAPTDALVLGDLLSKAGALLPSKKNESTFENPVLRPDDTRRVTLAKLEVHLGRAESAQARCLMNLIALLVDKGVVDLNELMAAMEASSETP